MSSNPNSTMETRSRNAPAEIKDETTGNPDAPSGFILKLYQMVNGAPDEVIAWTPTGDAFVIGSDLKRLESETLPQYFRHNRFQSLVRQLNFYSFRKINRERNVWIYKHELFHRDRPEDLHLVRRRTCPGLDGRKQRFSRYSARKITDSNSASEDEDSIEATPVQAPASPTEAPQDFPEQQGLKREASDEVIGLEESAKRRRGSMNSQVDETSAPKKDVLFVDTSLLIQASEQASPEAIEDESSQKSPLDDRMEMAERSVIISEVAKKLEQYARKASYGSGAGKGKRHATGIVTPQFGSSSTLPATHLLTYDDEYGDNGHSGSGIYTVTGRDGSSSDIVGHVVRHGQVVSPESKTTLFSPAANADIAEGISQRLLKSSVDDSVAKAAVVGFCVSNSPHSDKDIGGKISNLIASCDKLASQFQTYRAALDPFAPSERFGLVGSYQGLDHSTGSQFWELEASRSRAVDQFKIFAVNCINGILGKEGMMSMTPLLTKNDKSVLERTILVWSKNL